MKGRSYIIVTLVLAALISGGSYAATFSQSSATFNVTAAPGEIGTTAEATSGLPYWDEILPPPATEYFRGNAAGDQENIATQFPASGAHWDKVDDSSSDDDATYVTTSDSAWQEDLYHLPNHVEGAGTIYYVKIYIAARATGSPTQSSAYVHIKTNGTEYNSTFFTLTPLYASYSFQWDTNPQTGNAWTWTEIDNLQVGAGLRRAAPGVESRVTMMYVEVYYRNIPLTGNTPTGNQFTVTPHASYPGDLAVKVYLVNAEALGKAYHALSLNLHLTDSAEAGDTPNYRVLTLDNGVATFNLPGGVGANRSLSITGGTYTLVSTNPVEWQSGWTIVPDLDIEVSQR